MPRKTTPKLPVKNPEKLEKVELMALRRIRDTVEGDVAPHGPDRYPACLIVDRVAHDTLAAFIGAAQGIFRPESSVVLAEQLKEHDLRSRLDAPPTRRDAIYVAAFERLAYLSMIDWEEEVDGIAFHTRAEETHIFTLSAVVRYLLSSRGNTAMSQHTLAHLFTLYQRADERELDLFSIVALVRQTRKNVERASLEPELRSALEPLAQEIRDRRQSPFDGGPSSPIGDGTLGQLLKNLETILGVTTVARPEARQPFGPPVPYPEPYQSKLDTLRAQLKKGKLTEARARVIHYQIHEVVMQHARDTGQWPPKIDRPPLMPKRAKKAKPTTVSSAKQPKMAAATKAKPANKTATATRKRPTK